MVITSLLLCTSSTPVHWFPLPCGTITSQTGRDILSGWRTTKFWLATVGHCSSVACMSVVCYWWTINTCTPLASSSSAALTESLKGHLVVQWSPLQIRHDTIFGPSAFFSRSLSLCSKFYSTTKFVKIISPWWEQPHYLLVSCEGEEDLIGNEGSSWVWSFPIWSFPSIILSITKFLPHLLSNRWAAHPTLTTSITFLLRIPLDTLLRSIRYIFVVYYTNKELLLTNWLIQLFTNVLKVYNTRVHPTDYGKWSENAYKSQWKTV